MVKGGSSLPVKLHFCPGAGFQFDSDWTPGQLAFQKLLFRLSSCLHPEEMCLLSAQFTHPAKGLDMQDFCSDF